MVIVPIPPIRVPDTSGFSSELMAILKSVENIKAELKCGVCQSTLSNPSMTACSHMFCQSCLHRVFNRSGSTLCPLCKQKITLRACEGKFSDLVGLYLQMAGEILRALAPLKLPPNLRFEESQANESAGSAPNPLKRPMTSSDDSVLNAKVARLDAMVDVHTKGEPLASLKNDDKGKEAEMFVVEEEKLAMPPHSQPISSTNRLSARVEQLLERAESVAYSEMTSPMAPNPFGWGMVPRKSQNQEARTISHQTCVETADKETQAPEKSEALVPAASTTAAASLLDEISAARVSSPGFESELEILLKIRPELQQLLMDNRQFVLTMLGENELHLEENKKFASVQETDFKVGKRRKDEKKKTAVLAWDTVDVEAIAQEDVKIETKKKENPAVTILAKETVDVEMTIDQRERKRVTGHPCMHSLSQCSTPFVHESVQAESPANYNAVLVSPRMIRQKQDPSQEMVNATPSSKGSQLTEDDADENSQMIVKETQEEGCDSLEFSSVLVSDAAAALPKESTRLRKPSPQKKTPMKRIRRALGTSALTSSLTSEQNLQYPSTASPLFAVSSSQDEDSVSAHLEVEKSRVEMGRTLFSDSPLIVHGTMESQAMSQRRVSLRDQAKLPLKIDSILVKKPNENGNSEMDEMVICTTGCRSTEDNTLVCSFKKIFGEKRFVERVEEGATHLVALCSVNRIVRKNSLRLSLAHAYRLVVLCREWLEESVRTEQLQDPALYWVEAADGGMPGWQRARIHPTLFAGRQFLVARVPFENCPPEVVQKMIEKAGGKLVRYPWEFEPQFKGKLTEPLDMSSLKAFTIYEPYSKRSDDAYPTEHDLGCKTPVFSADWIIDSLFHYRLITTDLDKYRVVKKS